MAPVFFLTLSVLIRLFWPRLRRDTHWLCPVLMLALPFSIGGFHTATAAGLCLVLFFALTEKLRETRQLRFYLNPASAAVLALLLAYCLTPLWAADKGMAVFALPRFLAPALLLLVLMQQEDLTDPLLELVPVCGCAMTLLSAAAALIPGLTDYVTVNGRLAGFFQYPNSFAAFLLAGLILRLFRSAGRRELPEYLLLLGGIILSGSKTVFVLTAVFLPVLVIHGRKWKQGILLSIALVCALGLGLLADKLELLTNADRFTDISASSGTFLVRLLYFWDVLPAIFANPLGIGYQGYPAIEGSIQTGRYAVTYIHNGLLQTLLEAGWLPGLLLWGVLALRCLSPKTPALPRMVLLAVLAHSMMDFDLEYAVFWVLLLCCLDIRCGKCVTLRAIRLPALAASVLTVLSLWLGCGEGLYRVGKVDACLAVTPFHTGALTYQMARCQDPEELDALADKILALDPIHSLALTGKANAAFSRGEMRAMADYKRQAIASARYSTADYQDYFHKLYTAMELYQQAGDTASAEVCRKLLLEIPEMMARVSEGTHPLAYRTGDDPSLTLPDDYMALLQSQDGSGSNMLP